jgi:hypothetical protein
MVNVGSTLPNRETVTEWLLKRRREAQKARPLAQHQNES